MDAFRNPVDTDTIFKALGGDWEEVYQPEAAHSGCGIICEACVEPY